MAEILFPPKKVGVATEKSLFPPKKAASNLGSEGGIYDIAKGFIKNLPTNIARGYGGSQNEFAARAIQTVYDKAGIKRGSTSEKVADTLINSSGFAGLGVPIRYLTRDKDFILPGQDQPLIKQSKPFASASDFAGSLGEATLDTALMGTLGIGTLAKSAGKTVLKEGGEQVIKQATKPLVKRVGSYLAKEGVKDATVGGAYGLATELQNPDYTPESLLTSTGTGAVAGLILPPAMGKTLDLGISGTRAIGRTVKKTGTEVAESLTKYGTVPSNNIWDRVETGSNPVKQTGLQKAAVKTAGAITKAVELPRKIARMTDRFAPINYFQKDWTEQGVTTKDDLADNFQAAPHRARAEAIERAKNYVDTKLSFGDDWQDVKDYSQLLDFKDRLARGNQIVGGKSIDDVNAAISAIEQRLGPEKAQKLTQGVEYIQKFLSDELDKAVESGRLSEKSAAAFREAHPNYLPHVVLDFIDSEAGGTAPKGAAVPGAGKSYNMAESGFKKAEGSERDIMDLDEAMGKVFLENAMRNEKNKAITPLVEYGEKTGAFINLRNEQDVTLREQLISELSQLRAERDALVKVYKSLNRKDKRFVKAINDLNKEINSLSEKAIKLSTSFADDADDAAKLTARITTRDNTIATERYNAQKAAIADAVDKKRREVQLKIIDSDIADAAAKVTNAQKEIDTLNLKAVDSAEKLPEFQERNNKNSKLKNRLITEKNRKTQNPAFNVDKNKLRSAEARLRAAQDELAASSAERDFITSGDVRFDEPGRAPKITHRMENVGPTVRQQVKGLVRPVIKGVTPLKRGIARAEDKLGRVEAEKYWGEDILDSTISALSERKARASSIYDELKSVRDKKVKPIDYKKEGLDKISYYKNGVREDWLVPADLAEAIKHGGSDVVNSWTKVNAWLDNSLLGKAITKPASFVRAVSTTFNPVFSLISNPLRDIQTTQLTSDVKYRDIVHGLLNAVSGGRYDKKLTEEFLKSGASQSSLYREVSSPQMVIEKMMKDRQNVKVSNVLGKTVVGVKNLVPTIGEKMEQASRMAVFRRGLLDGLTPQQAAKQARDASVDFSKAGDVTATINRVIPFFNARIQGAINLKNAATKDPYRFARKMFYTAIYPTMVLNSYNSRFSSYENIPDSDKRKYWVIMYGQVPGVGYDGKRIMIPLYVALPKGEAQQGMSSVVDRIMKLGKEKYPESNAAFLGNLIKDFSPITESSLLPTVVQMPIELKTNYSLYRGTQIEPDYIPVPKNEKEFTKKSVGAETVEPGLRATKSTSVVANELGKLLNWSPSKIDYVQRTGFLNDIILGVDIAADKPAKKLLTEEEKLSQLPFVRSILRSSAYGVQQKKKEDEKTKAKEKNTKLFEKRLSTPPREQK